MTDTSKQASSGRADYVAVHHILSRRMNELEPLIKVDVPTFEDGQRVSFRLSGPKTVMSEVSWQRVTEPLKLVGYTDITISRVQSADEESVQETTLSIRV